MMRPSVKRFEGGKDELASDDMVTSVPYTRESCNKGCLIQRSRTLASSRASVRANYERGFTQSTAPNATRHCGPCYR